MGRMGFSSIPSSGTGRRNRLDGMDRLTPGDFRTVSQGLRLAGDHADNKARLDALAQEIARKPATEAWRLSEWGRNVIGFR